MREYKWRTAPVGTEGTNMVFVDSYSGSDVFGEGTRANPYRTLTKAYNAKTTKPTTIVCRGMFSEELTGNHTCEIVGDYLGAATFDGQDTYMLYGFGHSKMIIKNILPSPSLLLAGVGRAISASGVGNAYHVYGVCGSSAVLARCTHYMGVLGCTSTGAAANRNCVFARPRCHSGYRISIAGQGSGVQSNTYVNCDVTKRQKHDSSRAQVIYTGLFANFAMIANEPTADNYINCLFAADCKWYYFTGNTPDSDYYELVVAGSTSAERQASLIAALTAKYDELEIPSGSRKFPVFTGCVFSSQTTEDIFNDPEMDDYTLIPGCDADVLVSDAAQYYGALPPAINIPIKSDSAGLPGTWDEHTASGCVIVVDDQICFDTLNAASDEGEILSKVISINPETTQLNGVFAQFNSRFESGAYANRNNIFEDTPYAPGDVLPTGRYLALTAVSYDGNAISPGDVFVVSVENTSFTGDSGALALGFVDPNVMEVVYCRCRAAVYARVGTSDTLQAGATYLNDSGKTITYHNRNIVNGESFVCMIDGESFSCQADSTATIAVMFDDTRVPSVDWVPAQLFGEYFVAKRAGAIGYDEYGVPLSSGNYMSYQMSGLLKSTMDRRFIQFAVKVRRYGN